MALKIKLKPIAYIYSIVTTTQLQTVHWEWRPMLTRSNIVIIREKLRSSLFCYLFVNIIGWILLKKNFPWNSAIYYILKFPYLIS